MRGRKPNAKFGTSLLEHLEARDDGPFEIEWEADNGNWTDVIEMINSGTSKIEKVISR